MRLYKPGTWALFSCYRTKILRVKDHNIQLIYYRKMYLLMAALFLMLLVHILWKQKHKPWRHLPGPGPFSPLLFIMMSAFTSNNTMLLRRLYNKYQKVSSNTTNKDHGGTTLFLVFLRMDYVFCTLEKFPCFLWETSVKSRSYAVIQVIKNIFRNIQFSI